jgi:DNA-binding transcriptional LysR family regulator
MRRDNINDFQAFIAVARARSFTKAAAKLGVSQSALSFTLRQLEARLGIRLLTRTTRSVSLTEAGERLLRRIGPHFDEIEGAISALGASRDKPAGTIRLNSVEHASDAILWPVIVRLLHDYPDINVEIINDYQLVDIVAERYDAGVRLGEQVDKDMIALRIGPDFRMATVAAPAYFRNRPKPLVPQDLIGHSCIGLRLPTTGGLYVWEFGNDGHELKVRGQGRGVFNSVVMMRAAALAGMGIAYVPEDVVEADIKKAKLVRVLSDWCPPRAGYHLYYPSSRQHSVAFSLLVDALRYRQ